MSNSITDDYDNTYIEIMNYLGENFDVSYSEAAIHAEQLTLIAIEEVEEGYNA